jgi:hypothetical protein
VYVLAGARSFITESIEFAVNPYGDDWIIQTFLQTFGFIFSALKWVVPDFGYFNAIEDFVNGRNVSLVWVLEAIGGLAGLKTMIILGLAMLLFHRREVAEISV